MAIETVDLVLACLATWRLTSLLVREEGPYALLARARRALGTSLLGAAFSCFYCASVWVAAPFAWWLAGPSRSLPVVWLALSAAAILADRLTTAAVRPEILELDQAVARSDQGR